VSTKQWIGAGLGVIVAIVVVIFVSGLITTGNVFFQEKVARVTAHARVETGAYNPENITNQVYFFTTTCEDVGRDYANWKSNEADYRRQIQLADSARTQGEATQANNAAQQLSTAVSGALQQLQEDAASYDARSINYIAAPFKTHGLPQTIKVPSNPAELSNWMPPSCG